MRLRPKRVKDRHVHHPLRDADVHNVVAKVHTIIAQPELTPLILALAEQCLLESVRPEAAMMSLVDGNRHTQDNPRYFPQPAEAMESLS
ncbi:hypothetical protein GCM10007938_33610 [Vibrio zhanjiangensis]|uniref:Uncharacterized protein n=1 Tax=Vibrio zhanjiangensis TaxID=1046128 RepID=A0ABQ6F3P5_9VIBR|nr:hypothetical protein [Vibrio zhanjiangensis]GLT19579.1 hypothetical protein GCM10007938_33610 [Vibrio zhanjiangensis]